MSRLLLLLVTLNLGCLPALLCPARGGPPWQELVSSHFVLTTDVPVAEAQERLGHFEQAYDILERFAFQATAGPLGERIEVALFADRAEYHATGLDDWVAGSFSHDPFDPEDRPVIALYEEFGFGSQLDARQVMQHELIHFFVSRYLPNAPIWLNEGLATYYETALYKDGTLTFGRARRDHLHTLVDRGLPALGPLLTTTQKEFYADGNLNYAAAWLVVHLLNQGPGHERSRFYAFLQWRAPTTLRALTEAPAVAKACLHFDPTGALVTTRLLQPTGETNFDESVLLALRTVERLDLPTPKALPVCLQLRLDAGALRVLPLPPRD